MPQRRGLGLEGQEPVGAAASRGWARQPDPCQRAVVANRYLPVVGHTDGTLSVLELRSSKTVFRTEAHSPGPVTAIASTWNSIVSSGRYLSPSPATPPGTPSLPRGATVAPARTGGDLTVKMWRVFPYAEESLSPLRTFCCCHPAVVLCALGNRVTVGFEDPNSATYGLVQFGLGSSPRYDHRPQDDPTDHITGEGAGPRGSPGLQMALGLKAELRPPGLCCCPTLKLYACSSLDHTIRIWTAENKLLRWAGEGWGRGAAAWVSHLCPTRAGQLEGVQGWPGTCLCSCLGVLLREAGLDSHSEPPSRLLHLNGAPQALTFCSNNGDLVLALGSRLCLLDHRLYLPTSYLLKVCSEHRWAGQGCCGQMSCQGQGSRLLSLFRSCAKRSLMGWMTLHCRWPARSH